MQNNQPNIAPALTTFAALVLATSVSFAIPGDIDDSGYVNLTDLATFWDCFDGPNVAYLSGCDATDFDLDGDVDIVDYAAMQTLYGHTPIPLKNQTGDVIMTGSTAPYSARQTCGGVGCHDNNDMASITNGFLFQHGRTDWTGNIVTQDDFFGDGRYWIKGPGRYGVWGQSFIYMLAAKDNTSESQMDQTTFAWIRDCGGCHVAAGAGEYDRDGLLLYNETTGKFGYELLGKTPEDVELDGDYSVLDYSTGNVTPAAWDVTGLYGPDCLYCHRKGDAVFSKGAGATFGWEDDYLPGHGGRGGHYLSRKLVLSAGTELVDDLGEPVPAFAAASTAGQGWYSNLDIGGGGPPTLQIDYSVGVANGSLSEGAGGEVCLSPAAMAAPPKDQVCTSCHPLGTITGTVWFDERDVHYAKFNRLDDEDPNNDVTEADSASCNYCHPGGLEHEFGKGNSFQIQQRNELDYDNETLGFRSCRNCHDADSPVRHPDAPETPGQVAVHISGPMYETLSCQACHIPYALTTSVLFRDITIPGSPAGTTAWYYSADPLNPSDPDKSTWYPSLRSKLDSDGVERWFPTNTWINIYWGDWDQNGTPEVLTDDVIAPIPLWRVTQVVGSEALPVVTDDNGDGQLEINRPDEILAYIPVLQGNDSHGNPVATNPVLVRGYRFWYEDPENPGTILSMEHEGTGIQVRSYPYIWGMDHNVLAEEESWGGGDPATCGACHDPDSPVFDRLILVDPYGTDGQPVYQTVREMTGLEPNP